MEVRVSAKLGEIVKRENATKETMFRVRVRWWVTKRTKSEGKNRLARFTIEVSKVENMIRESAANHHCFDEQPGETCTPCASVIVWTQDERKKMTKKKNPETSFSTSLERDGRGQQARRRCAVLRAAICFVLFNFRSCVDKGGGIK